MSTAADMFECCGRAQSLRSLGRAMRTALSAWWASYEVWHNRERAAAAFIAARAAASRYQGGRRPV